MLFFDLDDTLLDHRGAQDKAAIAWHRELGTVPHPEANFPLVWHEAATRNWAAYTRGAISFIEQRRRRIREVLREPELSDLSADEHFARYLAHYEANWQLFPDVLPALQLLEGQRLGVLTDGDGEQQTRKLARLGLKDAFEVVVVLSGNGPRKPSPAAFKLAAQHAKVHALECLYIGDKIENDAVAARAAGWRGVWLDRTGVMIAPPGIERIGSLLDVPFLLGDKRF